MSEGPIKCMTDSNDGSNLDRNVSLDRGVDLNVGPNSKNGLGADCDVGNQKINLGSEVHEGINRD
jgi:hypothetical protein